MKIPYFLSAQIDATQRKPQPYDGRDSDLWEGWFGLVIFNVATWCAIVLIDIVLLSNEFNKIDTHSHVIQTGALVSVIVSGSTIVLFTLVDKLCLKEIFCSRPGDKGDAHTLPPFATALIAGGLKATLGFSYVLLLTAGSTYGAAGGIEKRVLELLVAQIALKHFGSAMALANQRLHLFQGISNTAVVPATY